MRKVSVILTSYNHEKWLREAIDSVLRQTWRDFELILWDDASSDNSWDIIAEYADPRIRTFRNPVQKRAKYGINKAISAIAVGEYIAIQHSDDVWEPGKLERQVEILDSQPEVGVVFTWANTIDDDGKIVEGNALQRTFSQTNRTRHEWLRQFLFHGNALCHPSALVRAQCYRDCGLYRPCMFQLPDFDMWIRLCLKYEIHVIPEPLVRFRWHSDGSNSSAPSPLMFNRNAFENYLTFENYRRIDKLDDVLKILPEARKYLGPEDSDPGFVLARTLLDITPYGSLRLFAQKMLFEIISDPDRAARIEEWHDFGPMDFREITGQASLFVTQAANDPTATPLAKGIEAFNAGDHPAALEHLARAMAQEPDNPLPLVYLAFIAVHQGLIPEARDFIARCEQIAPERQEIKAAFGGRLLKAGYPEIAVEYLQAVVSARPDMLAAYPLLAQSLNASGRYEEAVSILESTAVIPSDAQADIQNALLQILAEHGDWARLANWRPRRYSRDTGYCPVCGSVDVRWLPLPDYYRTQSERHGFKHFGRDEMAPLKTYSCPACGASDRERLMALFLNSMRRDKDAARPESVLHFAPEPALSAHIRQKHHFVSYRTADREMPGVDYPVDLQALPFDDDSFDFFICSHVLEHVSDDRKAIGELYRITRPGGGGILLAPIYLDIEKTREDPSITSASERWRLFGQDDHVRLYSHDDFVARIEEGGFSLRQMTRDDFGEEVFRLLGLKDSSILYVVNKPLGAAHSLMLPEKSDTTAAVGEALACADPLSAATQAFRDGNHEDAVCFLEAAIGKDPANPLSYVYLALISVRAGRTREAWEFIDHALKLGGELKFLVMLGEEFLNHGQPDEALRCLEPAIGRIPGLFSAYPALTEALRLTGRIDEAFDLLSGVMAREQGSLPADLKEWIAGALPALERQKQATTATMQDGLLRVRITHKCNAECRFCGIQFYEEKLRSMSLDKAMLYEYLVPLYEQIKILLLTGGEPLACEGSFEYARFLAENYPRITVFIESNGIAFTEKWRRLAKDHLFTTHFSINGSNARVFEAGCWAAPGGVAYTKALKHIESYIDMLRQEGLEVFSPGFSMVINKDTASDLRDFVRKTLRMGARYATLLFDYTENDMNAPYFGRPETSRPALEELMKLERILARKFFIYFRLWVPLKEVELLQDRVDAMPLSDLKAEYADILALAQNRSMLREHEERQRLRAARGKKIHTWDEDWTATIRQTEIDGQRVCFAPFKAMDIYPNGMAECCGWFAPRLRLADWIRDGAIDWNRLFNAPQMRSLRLDMLNGGYNLCMRCCPLNPRYHMLCPPHRYGFDRVEP